ncbi:MAG: single-stranded-DNA-specific exonuclease RecJ [Candidatus Kapabacteria bacterium]|nr:single-stranded-DNA-specific exonuclease RecJ [Candidatus Kapabacteria bacterium]
MNYRWIFREPIDENAVQDIVNTTGIPRAIARVLVGRGITSALEVDRFFNPSLDNLHSPWLMDGMVAAVDRIERAHSNDEMIWIHGDYDVDGTSSTAMVLHFLREMGIVAQYFIPDRTVGFGFTRPSVDRAIAAGATVIVTVDIGITAIDAISYAKNHGIDVIVCDHHEPSEELPPALAILDPIKPGCTYPFKHLAGCGVAFKLICAIADRKGFPEKALEYIDLVAIASAADIVPLSDENRIISYYGLKKLNENPRPGIKGLIDCAGLQLGGITNSSIVFGLAPRINAAGRLGDPTRAVEMMIQTDALASFRIAQELEQDNRRRRAIDEETFAAAEDVAARSLQAGQRRSLVIHQDDWHAGVIGIVASRLVERFHVPTIMLTTIDGIAKGSARSIKDFDIHNALKQCEDILVEYGGHKHAAGLSLRVEHVPELAERIDVIAKSQLTQDMLTPEIVIDSELALSDLTPEFFKLLAKFAPYGYSNHRPLFYSKNVVSANGVKVVGNNHLKFRALQKNFAMDAIGFNLGHRINDCSNGKSFALVYTLEENTFNGQTTPQLRIRDVRPL